jgi:putative transposase
MELLTPGEIYHVYNHANGNENLFREARNYPYFLDKCLKYLTPVAELYAYCLLPNHFHFLLKVKEEGVLNRQGFENLEGCERYVSRQFSNLFNSYSKSINKAYNRMGSLFVPRFKRKLISSDDQFRQTFLYIQLNAVKHGFVKHEDDWPYSSVHYFKSNELSELIRRDFVFEKFEGFENLLFCIKEKRERILLMNEEFD